ncbi:GNAT family N-acetyltransferase [Gottschalkia purinilytica]|uniref:GNAT family N-acetyltransferase n=1 Tax=Gottschalkia purinilytica TaxID=1503 RepID=UPI000E26F725
MLNINKITAQVGSFNIESNMLLKSLGFRLDGVLREHHDLDGKLYDDYVYSLLKREYKKDI